MLAIHARWTRSSEAPLLPATHVFGHLPAMGRDPLGLLERGYEVCGDVARLRMGPYYVHFLYAPEHIEHVLVHRASNYGKQTRGYAKLRLFLGNGLVTSEGDFWRRQRRIANPAFQKKSIEGFADTMSRRAIEATVGLSGTVDMAAWLSRLTMGIAAETLFGHDIGADAERIGTALAEVQDHFQWLVTSPWPWPEQLPIRRNRRFFRHVEELDQVVYGIIGERRRSGAVGTDLLGMLMSAVDEDGRGMSDQELRDEVMTLLLAGHETTSNTLAWTLHLLSENPGWLEVAIDEVERVVGNDPVALEHVGRLDVVDRVIREAMRLRPPVWMMARSAIEEDEIGGYPIPAQSFVFMAPWVTHRRSDLWPDPLRFDADRFLPDAVERRPKCAWVPFSIGQRKCIGDRFAQMEAVILLATILQRLRFVSLGPARPHPGVTLRPDGGLPMRIRTAPRREVPGPVTRRTGSPLDGSESSARSETCPIR